MHYKKRKLHKLHSIPIKIRSLCKKERLHLVSYSIPLSCMVVLLLGFGIMISPNPSNHNKSYALESDSSPRINVSHPEISMAVSLDTGDGYGNDIAGQVSTAPGAGTAYRSHKINITGTDIKAYQLVITGPSNLTPSSGASTIVSGAGGKTGSDMDGNTWGYAWGDIAEEVTSMAYNTMSEAGSNLVCTDPKTDYTVDCEKKLVFGANFASGADNGTYTAEVTVSLTATPYLIGQAWTNKDGFSLDTGIDDMQDVDKVDGGFCNKNIPAGSTITLRDSRGGVENLYKIIKMGDGSCWMAENLRLGKDADQVELTAADTDLNGGLQSWILPASYESEHDGATWNNSGFNEAMVKTGTNLGDDYKIAYGNYYSWCAATAGSCMDDSVALTNTDAPSSVCPKGWKLPASSGMGSFQSIYGGYPNSEDKVYWLTSQPIPYAGNTTAAEYNGKRFGLNSADTLFPAAGYIGSEGLYTASTDGLYWSRSAASAGYAYYLYFRSDATNPQRSYYNLLGHSVRCVYDAEPVGYWVNNDSGKGMFDSGLRNMQDVTKENFTTKYCAKSNTDVAVGATVRLMDSRDKKTYNIVKLDDGNCWMQENLALSGSITLTSADSDVDNDWTLPIDTQNWSTESNSRSIAQVKTGDTDLNNSWQTGWGNYYSWQAATAGTGNSLISAGQQANASICPKGWKLPTGGGTQSNGTGQFGVLNGLNKYTVQDDPYNFFASGWYASNKLQEPTTRGMYWSRTLGSNSSPYDLGFYNDFFFPGTTTSNFSSGASVRCIAEPKS